MPNSIIARLLTTVATCGLLTSIGLASVASAAPERQADGAVVVRALGQNDDEMGAGTIVGVAGNTVTIITAKHVAVYGPMNITFADGTRADAKIVSMVPGRDLAIASADVDPAYAASLHVATIGRPASNLPVHVWGSGLNGPAFETGSIKSVGAPLPDGAPGARYALDCALCHQGDSGAGVFDAHGQLVGIYIGFFVMDSGRLSIAEEPLDSKTLAAIGVGTQAANVAYNANASITK
jgi:S1-C subfamily serine protease